MPAVDHHFSSKLIVVCFLLVQLNMLLLYQKWISFNEKSWFIISFHLTPP